MSLRTVLTRVAITTAAGALLSSAAAVPALADDGDGGGGSSSSSGPAQSGNWDGGDGSSSSSGSSGQSQSGNWDGGGGGSNSSGPSQSGGGEQGGQRHSEGVVTAGELLLRSAPNRGSQVIRVAHRGQRVSIFCKTSGQSVQGNKLWYLLTDGTWAWGSARYIDTIGTPPRWC